MSTTIRSVVESCTHHDPDAIAIQHDERHLTFAELRRGCLAAAGALVGMGLDAGDRVAVIARNSLEYVQVLLAAPAAGLVVVPMNMRLAAAELRTQLEHCDPTVLVADESLELPEDVLRGPWKTVMLAEWADAVATAPVAGWPNVVGEDDLAAIFYTGGTTGAGKGVMVSHRNRITEGVHLSMLSRLSRDDVWLIQAPLFHVSGAFSVIACLWAGARQILTEGFEAERSLQAITSHGVTCTFGVPVMFRELLRRFDPTRHSVGTLRLLGYGGAPMAAEVQADLDATWPHVEQLSMYGSTEMASIATGNPHHERCLTESRARSCGAPAPLVTLLVTDPGTGAPVPRGEVGEVLVSGPNIMLGYWRNSQATQNVFHDGFYRTGDLGYQDAAGFVYLVDRLKDMIITGGENVYSAEVEAALTAHPAVGEAAVVGRADERWGEAVHAVVRLTADAPAVGEAELIEHCRATLASFKVPKGIDFLDRPLPRTAAGKLLKREVRRLVELPAAETPPPVT